MKDCRLQRFQKKITQIIVLLIICYLPLAISYAEVPHLLNYQGRLTDSQGVPLNGSYDLTFRIYDAEAAGNLLWEEIQAGVVIQKGIFGVLLGGATNLNLPFDKPYFLEIKVGTEVMNPRQRITSAGYAIRAERAETLDISSVQQGDILYYNGTAWTKLSAGNSGQYLKTQGIGAAPAWSYMPGIPNNIQAFTSSGTWVKPVNVSKVYVKVWGGGGGGGRGNPGAGGGGGGYSEGIVNVSGNVPVIVGAAGAGQTAYQPSTGGGTGSFQGDTTIQASGGGGASDNSPGGGGGGSGGSININGGSGFSGAGYQGNLGQASYYFGGEGGYSPFGGGISPIARDSVVESRSGLYPGGGGSGSSTVGGSGTNGNSGASGLVIVYW